MSYGGYIENGVWIEGYKGYQYDKPDPSCYACGGIGSYWCGLIGCKDSAGKKKGEDASQAIIDEEFRLSRLKQDLAKKVIDLARRYMVDKDATFGEIEDALQEYDNA